MTRNDKKRITIDHNSQCCRVTINNRVMSFCTVIQSNRYVTVSSCHLIAVLWSVTSSTTDTLISLRVWRPPNQKDGNFSYCFLLHSIFLLPKLKVKFSRFMANRTIEITLACESYQSAYVDKLISNLTSSPLLFCLINHSMRIKREVGDKVVSMYSFISFSIPLYKFSLYPSLYKMFLRE